MSSGVMGKIKSALWAKPAATPPKQRMVQRHRGRVLKRSYDVGSQAYIYAGGLTSNQQIFHALTALRRICQDQYRRSDYAKGAVRVVPARPAAA